MRRVHQELLASATLVALLGSFVGCGGGGGNPPPPPPKTFALTVAKAGSGSGTVASSPTGINCGSDCSESYNSGTSVTLTATPASNSAFAGWSGDCTGTGTCVLSMTKNRSVTATFDALTVSVSPATASVLTGGTQQFIAKDQGGSVVDTNWFVNDVQSGNLTVGTIDISGLYTAPSVVPSPATVTVKACSREDGTRCGTAAVTIAAPPEKIAFRRHIESPSVSEEIWRINPDGTELQQLTSNPGYQNLDPAFSPDGRKIAFATNRDGISSIYIMDTDGSNQMQLNTGYDSTWPSWSPDGKKIAFIYKSNATSEVGVAVIDLETGDVQKLTQENCGGGSCKVPDHPTWSPDGAKIAFSSPRSGGQWDIHVMNADGTEVVNITNTASVGEHEPSWSPDGNLIAFMSNATGHWEIYTMRPDGSGVRKLTTTPTVTNPQEGALDPAWSPDCAKVIFARSAGGSMVLYTVLADGTTAEQPLPNSPDACRYPTWARIR